MSSSPPPEPEWRVYGFPELELLVFSTKLVLHTPDRKQALHLEKASSEKGWSWGMSHARDEVSELCASLSSLCFLPNELGKKSRSGMATSQILKIGGYHVYAQALQATLNKLVKVTLGDPMRTSNDGAPAGVHVLPRPDPYVLDQFCVSWWWCKSKPRSLPGVPN